ncbi:MAG: hypothetical protein J3Q66DRAFT_347842 [Benniella sp.]|nr:MAG: hypothetical protein J3Q66DRAFT_347842 [Benniella sp.]
MQAILSAFLHLTSWSIRVNALCFLPGQLQEILGPTLTEFMSQLTTLEILPTSLSQSAIIHELLCLTPNLLHLKAKEILLNISDMTSPNGQRLWACRRLQTFHIGIQPCMVSMGRGQQDSRIFFAYLVKCFPYLRDIHIHYSDIDLTLESGFCLLSELHHLEKLVLHTWGEPQSLGDRDMDWMSTLAIHGQRRSTRIHRKAHFQGVKISSQDKETDLQHQQYGKEAAVAATCAADAALHQAIWEASTLLHVISVLERLWSQQTIGVYCWPYLELLQLSTWSTSSWVPVMRPELLYQERKPLTGCDM